MMKTHATCQSSLTGIIRHPGFLAHESGTDHVEAPRRLERIYTMLDNLDGTLPLTLIDPRRASEKDLLLAHSAAYIQQIAATANFPYSQLTADTYACSGSFAAASLAAGAVMSAIDAVCAQQAANVFVLARPPGHHAESSRANGYCLFNNVAVGARYAQRCLGWNKVLIIDWDLHHGNGIQHIFEQDATVLYFSTHQYPLFPGTGHVLEVGRGAAEGFTINVPLDKGFNDADFAFLYQALLEPVCLAFQPELILVAAGFDIHEKDPVGKMKVTETGFAALTRIVMNLAQACCGNRVVLVLEGGYHQEAMAHSVLAVLHELCGRTRCNVSALAAQAESGRVDPVVRRSEHVLSRYWPDVTSWHSRRL
jgi:acetoin utilization deacetylase AcuC-like enzyme